jgi:hypothetical protein
MTDEKIMMTEEQVEQITKKLWELVIEHDAFQHVSNSIIARTNAQDFVFEIVKVMSQELTTLETKVKDQEREKVLALLVDEDSFELSRSCIDDGNDFSGDIFLRVEARNNLRAELRQQIKEMR